MEEYELKKGEERLKERISLAQDCIIYMFRSGISEFSIDYKDFNVNVKVSKADNSLN